MRSLFIKTPTNCKNNIANSDIIALSAFYNIMELILAQRCVPDARDSNSAIHVNAAMQYISDNFSDSELTALAVSKAIVIAPKYLSRIFKQQTGTDLGRYITNRRLSAATELMQKCEYSLAEISRMCGFASPYYFSVVFKKYNKITPSMAVKEYKNKLRR